MSKREYICKYKVLLIAELILICVVLTGCFLKKGERVFFAETEGWSYVNAGQEQYLQSEPLYDLPAGVYRIIVNAPEERAETIVLGARAYGISYGALKVDDVSLSEGQTKADFEMYLTEKVSELHLVLLGAETAGNESIEVSLYSTGLAWSIVCFWLVACSLAVNSLLFVRERYLCGKIKTEELLCGAVLLGAVVLACSPWLVDYFFLGEDTIFYMAYIEELRERLSEGCFFSALAQGSRTYAYDNAFLSICRDLFFLLPALLRSIGFSAMSAYKGFGYVLTAVGAYFSYISVRKCVGNTKTAALGAVVYTLAPYRLFVLYGQGGLGEHAAMAIMPLVVCGIYLLPAGRAPKQAKWYMAAGLMGVLPGYVTVLTRASLQEAADGIWRRGFPLSSLLQFLPSAGGSGEGAAPMQPGIVVFAVWLFLWYLVLRKCSIGKRRETESVAVYGAAVVFAILVTICWVLGSGYFPWDAVCRAQQLLPFFAGLGAVFGAFMVAFFVAVYYQEAEKGLAADVVCLSLLFAALMAGVYQVNDIAYERKPVRIYNAENLATETAGEYLADDMAQDALLCYESNARGEINVEEIIFNASTEKNTRQ